MPRFLVQIEGSNIEVPGDIAGVPTATIRGFFTTRILSAATATEAGAQAKEQVAAEWSQGEYARVGASPALRIAEARPLRWREWLKASNAGYFFHPGEWASAAAHVRQPQKGDAE